MSLVFLQRVVPFLLVFYFINEVYQCHLCCFQKVKRDILVSYLFVFLGFLIQNFQQGLQSNQFCCFIVLNLLGNLGLLDYFQILHFFTDLIALFILKWNIDQNWYLHLIHPILMLFLLYSLLYFKIDFKMKYFSNL